MEAKFILAIAIIGLVGSLPGRADSFGNGANIFSIDFVPVANAGNPDDAGAGGGTTSGLYGGVAYDYRISVTEVAADWIAKASAVDLPLQRLVNVSTGPWTGSKPAAGVTWYEAAAFVNWLNTSTGHQAAYDLDSGATALALWDPSVAWQLGGQNLYRHKDAWYFLPSEDEWYKAAYHKNDGVTANYWDYPTASNTAPTAVISGTAPVLGNGTAVFGSATTGATAPADVDVSGTLSGYGTRGQGGNLREWMESAHDGVNDLTFVNEGRTTRGGSLQDTAGFLLSDDASRVDSEPGGSDAFVGFRIASVPEPSAAVLILIGGLLFLPRRRCRISRGQTPAA